MQHHEAAIEARPPNVVVHGLTIERYTLRGITVAPAALIETNEVRYVPGTGIRVGTRCKIVRNYVHHNGKYGMNGGGEDALLEGNELAYNNAAAYRTKGAGGCWDAGATKFAVSTGLVVRNNYAHHNYCDGFWSDIDNINGYAAVVRNNQIRGNMASGIFHRLFGTGHLGQHHRNNGIGMPMTVC